MRRRDRVRYLATWLALAGSIVVGLLFVWIRATTPSDGARISFYGDAWTSAGVQIDPIDAPAAGLASGDLIVAVDGQSVDAWLGISTDRSAPRPDPGAAMPYAVVTDGQPQRIDVTWTAPALGATLLAGWSVVLFSVSSVAIAAFVFARRPDEPAATALMLAACAVCGSSVPWFAGTTVSDIVLGAPFVLHAFLTGPLYMLLWPAGLHLALVFPKPLPIVLRRGWLIPAVYAVALGAYAAAMGAGAVATTTNLEWAGTWPVAQVAVVVPLLSLSLAVFVRSYRRTTDVATRTRIRWAWLGVVASGGIGLLCFMLPELVLQRTLLPASWIGITAMPLPLGIAAGILLGHLFDIDVVVRRTFVYGGLTLGVIATYVAVASGITSFVGGGHGFEVSLVATGVAALVALPLRDGLQRGVTRLLYGERDEPWRAMRRLGQRLDLAADPDRAYPVIVDTVADALRLPFVALEIVDDVGVVAVAAERGQRQDAAVVVPLMHQTDHVGRLVLGVRPGERGFRSDEMDLLGDLAHEAGNAIHALRLRDDLARSHERLLLAREEERRRLRRDLHDGLGPSLAAIGLRAEASAEILATDPATATRLLDELGADVQTTLGEIRRLVDGLRPPALDELGLVGAIEQQAARLEGWTGSGPMTTITVTATPIPLPDMPAAIEVAAYRIAVEALTNAIRHAEARTCGVRLDAGEQLVIEVVDDGHGLPAAVVRGTGLESMETRATELGGSLWIAPRHGGGTRLEARLPLTGRRASRVVPADGAVEGAGP